MLLNPTVARWLDHLIPPDTEAPQFVRLAKASLLSSALSSLGAVVCFLQFDQAASRWPLQVWLALYCGVAVLRMGMGLFALSLISLRLGALLPQRRGLVLAMLVGSLLHGLLWGGLGVLTLTPEAPLAEGVLHVALSAMAMGTMHLSAFFPAMVFYVIAALGSLVVRDLWIGWPTHGVLAFCVFCIGVYALLNGKEQARALQDAAGQRLRNADLIEALHRENERSEAARQAALEAVAARSRFFAAANHDLRQPLHAMGLLAHTLVSESRPGSTAEHLAECVDGMTQVIDELLDLSRLDSGHLPPNLSNFALQDLLHEACRPYQTSARLKGLELVVAASPLWVRSDRAMLYRVLSNLVSNAIRYSPSGEVSVEAHAQGERVQLRVQDHGIGIAAEHLPRIFEEFYQVGNPARDRRQGLGLGLATVKRLSDLLGLAVSVQSRPGEGTCFELSVPQVAAPDLAAEPAGMAAGVAGQAAPVEPLAGARVLVIEDDADSRAALLALLQSWQCEVVAVADEAAALQRLVQGWQPQAVVADLRLADGRSGADAVRAVRARVSAGLPALIATGDAGSAAAQAAQASGLQVLIKPVRPVQLRAFLAQAQVA